MPSTRPTTPALLACLALLAPGIAAAHVEAGNREFPVTLTFDDPGVGDEISLPSLTYSRDGAEDGVGPSHQVDLGFEFDKTITPTTALILNDGTDIIQTNGAGTRTGFDDLVVTGKWQLLTNAPHEAVVSLGLGREIGRTGTVATGAERYGWTQANAYAGKGLGDLGWSALRPVAFSGELSYLVSDRGLKAAPDTGGTLSDAFGAGQENRWSGAFSVQYSLPYREEHVHEDRLPGILSAMIPLVEFDWSAPATSPNRTGTAWTAAPGAIWLIGEGVELGVEALVPLSRSAGTTVGAIGLVHLFFAGLLPQSLGRPLFP